jgi:SAM-dependent methyltransferase
MDNDGVSSKRIDGLHFCPHGYGRAPRQRRTSLWRYFTLQSLVESRNENLSSRRLRKHPAGRTTAAFASLDWRELRLDIDPTVSPDIVGTMTDMADVPDESVDAVFSSHNIEHLYPHEVPLALAEFLRVMKPGGFAVITCPDLQSIAALVAEDKLTDAAYVSPSGPIAPIDILFGYRPQMAIGNLYMAHHCGFTE